jgi:hypothetical protein
MKKTRNNKKNINRRKKTTKKYAKKHNKQMRKIKGGNVTISVANYHTLFDSFQLLQNALEQYNLYKQNPITTSWVSFSLETKLNAMLGTLNLSGLQPFFLEFFKKLVAYLVHIHVRSYSVEQETDRNFKNFVIIYVLGFIIAYIYKNPTNFKDFDKDKPFLNTVIFLFQNIGGAVLCPFNSNHQICKIREHLDRFIFVNGFYVANDQYITMFIFDFFEKFSKNASYLLHFLTLDKVFKVFNENTHLRPKVNYDDLGYAEPVAE